MAPGVRRRDAIRLQARLDAGPGQPGSLSRRSVRTCICSPDENCLRHWSTCQRAFRVP